MNDRISIPAGHPAFWTVAKAAIFATDPIVELRDNLISTLEAGDERATRRAAGELRRELSLKTTEEWRRTGHPKPSTLDELKRVMALVGFDADTIHDEQWTPASVAPIVLAKLGGRGESETNTKAVGNTTPTKRRGGKANAAMLDVLMKKPECRGWTITQWVEETGFCRGAICGCKTWKELKAARDLIAAERATTKKRRSKGRRK